MPVRVLRKLPAIKILQNEDIFVMQKSCNTFKERNSLKVLILNLMPKKIETENQFLRVLSNSPLQVDIQLLRIDNHVPKHTPVEHLNKFYCSFPDIQYKNFDGLIVTGAPLGLIDFEDITFWPQIKQLFLWAKEHINSILFVCWAVQAALKILYNLPKFTRQHKLVGIYQHNTINSHALLTKGFDEIFLAPHSRYSDFPKDVIYRNTDLEILAESDEAGAYLLISQDKRLIFITGHPEYDAMTLHQEYYRDLKLGLSPMLPDHYFPQNNPNLAPKINWRSHAYLLFANWLNHYVYNINITKHFSSV
ncbi:homoserine O-succinyltransferase [Blochmannia endosymbiont of Camponotus sp. C-003]|uniref:homoserine O-succinyltransferase n=1 Tax=unclassified Candidatus Blochmanniella TaxID=711328 RepID=UPI00202421D8|nr:MULTISPECIES: homoserine O-succinyltransferase [unclassified Candidatus Blochmannia]URJ23225.1 homoserine O-succinyltransferase [Blochmannia endosymbiont of Camponotus sp. C-003]URJ28694.1 homoserine O-succinyltransferase [Blochmannia endosymbiont of Camponotus sp. C-046]